MDKISIVGYGRMGRAIESLWVGAQKSQPMVITSGASLRSQLSQVLESDVVFEFTSPDAAADNLDLLGRYGAKVVCGTTGWLAEYPRISEIFKDQKGALFYASNFSPGMNILFWMTQKLAFLNRRLDPAAVSINETHHIHKLDAPSGTAITLAEQYIEGSHIYDGWSLSSSDAREVTKDDKLPITALREGEVLGHHELTVDYPLEKLKLSHEAKDRSVFARGALLAGQYISNRQGIFGMADMLNIEGQ